MPLWTPKKRPSAPNVLDSKFYSRQSSSQTQHHDVVTVTAADLFNYIPPENPNAPALVTSSISIPPASAAHTHQSPATSPLTTKFSQPITITQDAARDDKGMLYQGIYSDKKQFLLSFDKAEIPKLPHPPRKLDYEASKGHFSGRSLEAPLITTSQFLGGASRTDGPVVHYNVVLSNDSDDSIPEVTGPLKWEKKSQVEACNTSAPPIVPLKHQISELTTGVQRESVDTTVISTSGRQEKEDGQNESDEEEDEHLDTGENAFTIIVPQRKSTLLRSVSTSGVLQWNDPFQANPSNVSLGSEKLTFQEALKTRPIPMRSQSSRQPVPTVRSQFTSQPRRYSLQGLRSSIISSTDSTPSSRSSSVLKSTRNSISSNLSTLGDKIKAVATTSKRKNQAEIDLTPSSRLTRKVSTNSSSSRRNSHRLSFNSLFSHSSQQPKIQPNSNVENMRFVTMIDSGVAAAEASPKLKNRTKTRIPSLKLSSASIRYRSTNAVTTKRLSDHTQPGTSKEDGISSKGHAKNNSSIESDIIAQLGISQLELETAEAELKKADEKFKQRHSGDPQFVMIGEALDTKYIGTYAERSTSIEPRLSSRRKSSSAKTPTSSSFPHEKSQHVPAHLIPPAFTANTMVKKATPYSTSTIPTSNGVPSKTPSAVEFVFEGSYDKISRKDSVAQPISIEDVQHHSGEVVVDNSNSSRGVRTSSISLSSTDSVMSQPSSDLFDSPTSNYFDSGNSADINPAEASTSENNFLYGSDSKPVLKTTIFSSLQTSIPRSIETALSSSAHSSNSDAKSRPDGLLDVLLRSQMSQDSIMTIKAGNFSTQTLHLSLSRPQSPPCEYDAELELVSMYLGESNNPLPV